MHLSGPKAYAQPPAPPVMARGLSTARATNAPPAPIVRWWFAPGQTRTALLWIGLTVVSVILYFISKPPAVSPLIASYLDLLDPQSRWALPLISAAGLRSFVLSFLFIVIATACLWLTYAVTRDSYVEAGPEADGGRTRYFRWAPGGPFAPGRRWATLLFLVMLLTNAAMFYFYHRRLQHPHPELTGGFFRTVYFLAMISRLGGLFLGVGIVLQYFIEDYGARIADFFRAYRSYFYPPLLAIAIVAFVFTRMDQFDGLFIQLMDSAGNFLLFSLFLFPASIAIIWFAPSYLAFTDRQFASRNGSWDIVSRLADPDPKFRRAPGLYAWTLLHKRLFPQLDTLPPDPPPPAYRGGLAEQPAYPSAAFHRFRTFLALFYICSLIGICADIYFDNQPSPPAWGSWIVYGTVLLVTAYLFVALRQTNLAVQDPDNQRNRRLPRIEHPFRLGWLTALEERAREKRRHDGHLFLKEADTVTFVRSRRWFLLGFVLTCGALLLFLVTFVLVVLDDVPWQYSFRMFLGFLVLSVFGFAWLSLYQSFFNHYTFNDIPGETRWPYDATMDRLDHLSTQTMLLINPLLVALALAFFLVGLFWQGFAASDFVAWLNPLNIYLLLINGVIAGILLVDRFLLLRERKRQYLQVADPDSARLGKASTTSLVWAGVTIAFVLAMSYLGNSYHEIPYQPVAAAADPSGPVDLDAYVAGFVADTSRDGPVIFVAADGGGLKACYWTMLNLYRLDTMGLYDGHVFALSGASGGTIGLSMYNYLKARGALDDEIPDYIEDIGAGNFLSGDFTGLLTRFPLNYWPNLPDFEPKRWDDRMESMARSYFRIVGRESDRFGYESIRARPFWYPWSLRENLPLLIVNTARAEDGLLGTITPLRDNPLRGSIDLTRNYQGEAISYPDATFLSNRFPIASPAGRIIGKGHFLDAGSADNSGLNSIYGLLRELKSRQLADTSATSPYARLFARGIVVISLRNAGSRYVRDEFLDQLDLINRYPYKSEFSANTGVAVNTGLTGVPISWDDYLRGEAVRQLGLVDRYLTVNLPFRLREGDVFAALGGELRYPQLDAHRRRLNHRINARLGPDSTFAVMPPLGRLLAPPIRKYMKSMLGHPGVDAVYRELEAFAPE